MRFSAALGRRVAAMASVILLGACASDSTPSLVAPILPGNPAIPSQFRGAAFIMDVSATRKTVRVTAPSASINSPVNANLLSGDVQYSLLGGDAVEILTSNFQASAVGAVEPGKVNITFDMQILNKLDGLQLSTPTFPTPPSGVTGVQAFPFEISVTTTSGGVTSNGNEIVVVSPRFGAVVPSSDWGNLPIGDGNFHNFFNDVGCTATANDCFRYEPFAPIAPLNTSANQRVGFSIDPTVGDFRVRILVAADLVPTVTAAPGTVAGTVTSNIGPIAGALISVSGGFSGSSNPAGAYSISGVASGANRTVSISNLPSGCTANQASFANQTVPAAASLAINFVVTCLVPTGNVIGTITAQQGGLALANVSVVVTPTGGAALATVTTAANGSFIRTGVPTIPAMGGITLSGLPAGCVNESPYSYTGHTTAGTTRNIVVDCPPPPVTYPLTGTWAIVNTGTTGREAQLTVAINMGSAPGNPLINGTNADEFAGIVINVGYNGTQLVSVGRTLLSPPDANGEPTFGLFANGFANPGTANTIQTIALTSVAGLTLPGNLQLMRLRYSIATGFSGTVTPTMTVNQALAGVQGLSNITSSVVVTIPALIVP